MPDNDTIVALFAMCIVGLFIVIGLLVWYIIEIRKLRKSVNANRKEEEADWWKPEGWHPET